MQQSASVDVNPAEVIETLTLRAGFNTNMVILGTTLLGLAAGVVGVFALLRKRAMVADALSHATLPGLAVAFLFATLAGYQGRSLPILLLGAAISATLGVLAIQTILRYSKLNEDAAIGIVLSVSFGVGIVGFSYIQANAPAGAGGLNGFIYGQAATLQTNDVILMGSIALAAVLAATLLLKEFALVCFNDAFAKVNGWPVSKIDLFMMALVIAVTVAGIQAVGLILVIALLIIPPVTARFWTERLSLLIATAGAIGALSGYLGASISALAPRKPAGAVIVLTAGVIFALSMLLAPRRGVLATLVRRLRTRLTIAADHLLEHAHVLNTPSLTKEQLQRLASTRNWSPTFKQLLLTWLSRTPYTERACDGAAVSVTKLGLNRGATVARNHALWEQYLISYADIAPSHVDWSVDQVEHVLTPELIEELETKLGWSSEHARAVVEGT